MCVAEAAVEALRKIQAGANIPEVFHAWRAARMPATTAVPPAPQ